MAFGRRKAKPIDAPPGWRPDSPLISAVMADDIEAVRRIAASGADLEYRWVDDRTALHAAVDAWHPGPLRALLEAGAEVDPEDARGNTPLMLAVLRSRGRGESIRLLLDAGADPHHTSSYGYSPVSAARQVTNFDVAQYFTDID